MSHLPDLMKDLALILISAGIITVIFKWLKQPLVLGYIVAGLLAGPYIHIFPSVIDTTSINVWAEIGVVFLLFALGLEFSFKKLANVGGSAAITATTEVISMLIIGYCLGKILGWSTMDCIFLGGMLSMSSTTIIIKAFNDLGLRTRSFTSIVFGTLIVEDLVAILMMVLISAMAVTNNFAGEIMFESILKVIFFLTLWFVIGIYFLPVFFKKAQKLMNDETLLVISLGLCLGMVVLAVKTDFSPALGAFIMGSILAETIEAEHIEHIIKPVKDFFGAIFFVSVGMLVNPAVLIEHAWPVVIITLVTIIGKAFFSSFGVLLSGRPLKTAIQSGFSLAQIGEFAFIIASLGISLRIMSDFIYPIIVAVSVITTFTTPYSIKLSEPFSDWLYKVLPNKTIEFLNLFSSGSKTVNRESDWKKLLKNYFEKITIYVVLLIAIILLSFQYAIPFIQDKIPNIMGTILAAIITLLCMTPFLMALVANKSNSPELFMKLWNYNKFNKGRLISLILLRVFVAVAAVTFVLINLFHFGYIWGIIIALAAILFIFFFREDFNQYQKMEDRFISNLNQREEEEKKQYPLTAIFKSQLKHKNIHIANLFVSADSSCIGKTLQELNFRNEYGVSIVKITRGSRQIYIPGGSDCIYPHDKIAVVGTDEQISLFAEKIEIENNSQLYQGSNKEADLQSLIIDENFPYMGMSIRKSEIGKNHNCLIVGIERGGITIMNPNNSTILEQGDLVWMVVEKNKALIV